MMDHVLVISAKTLVISCTLFELCLPPRFRFQSRRWMKQSHVLPTERARTPAPLTSQVAHVLFSSACSLTDAGVFKGVL